MKRAFTALLLAGCLSLATGCRTTGTATTAPFPFVWPHDTPIPVPRAAASIGRGTGIALAVAPWTWTGAPESAGTLTTTEALTQLTQASLRAQGFDVVDEHAAAYRVGCNVHELSTTMHSGFPGQRQYLARVACQLVRSGDQQMLWQRDFEEQVDETTYVNTYTRLPAHEARAFAQECLPAVMERVTDSLLIFFREELPLQAQRETTTSPAPAGAATPSSYTK